MKSGPLSSAEQLGWAIANSKTPENQQNYPSQWYCNPILLSTHSDFLSFTTELIPRDFSINLWLANIHLRVCFPYGQIRGQMGCLLPKTLTSKMWKCVYFCFKSFRNMCLFAYIHRYTHKHMYVFVCMSKNETLVCFYCEPRKKVWAGLCLSCLCNR